MRREAKPARGLLNDDLPGDFQHRRVLPADDLAPLVAHFWFVQWSCPRPVTVETLPHPTVHVTVERSAVIGGVATRRFTRRLRGDSRVFGIKFRPAAFAPLLEAPLSTITDRTIPARRIFGDVSALLGAADFDEAIGAAEAMLRAHRLEVPAEICETRDLVERIESDRALVRVDQVARLAGLTERTLQRRFRDHVGVSAKWVISRYRLHEAIERLRAGEGLVELAGELGYFDQAHFSRAFKAMVGRSPGNFANG